MKATFPLAGHRRLIFVFLLVALASCSNSQDNRSNIDQPAKISTISDTTIKHQPISTLTLCDSIRTLATEWKKFGVQIDNCGSQADENGDDVLLLIFNDPAEWHELAAAMGDIPAEEAAKYAFWRMPLGLLAISFYDSKKNPEDFKDIYIYFDDPNQTTYGILPRDISWAINISESLSKEAFSEELNSRIDEISERVEVIRLNE